MNPLQRIERIITGILPFARTTIDHGREISWLDIKLGEKQLTIEYHNKNKIGICVPANDPTIQHMASYYVEDQVEAIDLALKLLVGENDE